MILAVFAALAVYVQAECNNMCSGHGTCGVNDMCSCYRNWRGADCSERTCQFGRSIVDSAQGDLNHDGVVEFSTHNALFKFNGNPGTNLVEATGVDTDATDTGDINKENEYIRKVRVQWKKATFELFPPSNQNRDVNHVYMECSNKGICDRTTGECACFEGYEGSACQRSVCPNKCSGRGVCRNLKDRTQTTYTTTNVPAGTYAVAGNYTYNLWDASKLQACVCDPGYSGIDCSERLCPKGDDPLNPNQQAQVDHVTSFGVKPSGGSDYDVDTFRLQFTDAFGEEWLTRRISFVAYGTDTSDDGVAQALLGIPNNVIPSVTVTTAASGSGTGKKYIVTYTGNPGSQSKKLKVVDFQDTVIDDAITDDTAGDKTNEECSSRGLCDYETGVCKCFRGYRLNDCSGQSALAYATSA